MHEFRLQESGKVPLPTKMYTKPVDVSAVHTFSQMKKGVSYDPLPWSEFFDRKETLGG
jgi:hypothetical protein